MLNTDLCRLFRLIYETHSLSEAARLFPMSLSRASRMLSALRENLGDELFTRADNRLFPTARGRELYPKVLRLLSDFEEMRAESGFSPERESRIVTVGCLDLDLVSILSGVLPELKAAAPGIRINFSLVDGNFDRELRKGACDLVFYPTTENYPGVKKLAVCEDAFVFVCLQTSELAKRKRAGEAITEEEVLERLAVQVTVPVFNSDNTAYGQFSGNVEGAAFSPLVWVPFFATVPFLLRGEATSFLPFQEAVCLQQSLPIEILGRPRDLAPYETFMLWSEQAGDAPYHQWIRSFFRETIRKTVVPVDGVPVLEKGWG